MSSNSVSHWIDQLKAGQPDAAQKIWERYCARLVHLARHKLGNAGRQVADEEDVVLSAFKSFCFGAARGGFTKLDDRDDLWQLLFMLTERKAADLFVQQRRQKRGGGCVVGDLVDYDLTSPEPTPAFAAEVAEEFRRLLDLLEEDELRQVALQKLEGYSVEDIAVTLGCVSRTVERKLRLIRKIWMQERVARGAAQD